MKLVCLDLEGVLVPEIWIEFAEKTGIEELKRTTRDEPNYDILMKSRIGILKNKGLTLKDVQDVIAKMKPMEGAKAFLDELRSLTQVIILSDTFEEFATPLMRQLDFPTIFCNHLIVNNQTNMIEGYKIRKQDGKKSAIEAFSSINIGTFAAGDSYNDLTMIQTANTGMFFRPPAGIVVENPSIKVADTYEQLLGEIKDFIMA